MSDNVFGACGDFLVPLSCWCVDPEGWSPTIRSCVCIGGAQVVGCSDCDG